jgi:hypothetical protein
MKPNQEMYCVLSASEVKQIVRLAKAEVRNRGLRWPNAASETISLKFIGARDPKKCEVDGKMQCNFVALNK